MNMWCLVSKKEERVPVDPCDNSNDSGLGFDHHLEYQVTPQSSLRFSDKEVNTPTINNIVFA